MTQIFNFFVTAQPSPELVAGDTGFDKLSPPSPQGPEQLHFFNPINLGNLWFIIFLPKKQIASWDVPNRAAPGPSDAGRPIPDSAR
jgi:hypothetical protein